MGRDSVMREKNGKRQRESERERENRVRLERK